MTGTIEPFGWRVPEGSDPPDGPGAFADLATDVAATIVENMHLGEVKMFAASVLVPDDWLVCDGAAIPLAYPQLIAAIGANTPNLTNRVPMGGGTARALGGSLTRTLAIANLPAHSHTISGGSHSHTVRARQGGPGPQDNNVMQAGGTDALNVSNTAVNTSSSHSHTAANTGSGTAVDITPNHCRLVFAIYAGPRAE